MLLKKDIILIWKFWFDLSIYICEYKYSQVGYIFFFKIIRAIYSNSMKLSLCSRGIKLYI